MSKMSDRQAHDRPREKLAQKGSTALSDYELLMAIIGSGSAQADVTTIAKDVLKILRRDRILTMDTLRSVKGLGNAKIAELVASYELASRYLIDSEQPVIDSPEKAVEQLSDIRDKKQEYFVCLTLDGANRLISKRVVTIGTLTSSLVHPREVFVEAISDRAAGVVVAHNHPSGILKPTKADIEATARLKDAAELIGIYLVDHIIVTKTGFTSVDTGDKTIK